MITQRRKDAKGRILCVFASLRDHSFFICPAGIDSLSETRRFARRVPARTAWNPSMVAETSHPPSGVLRAFPVLGEVRQVPRQVALFDDLGLDHLAPLDDAVELRLVSHADELPPLPGEELVQADARSVRVLAHRRELRLRELVGGFLLQGAELGDGEPGLRILPLDLALVEIDQRAHRVEPEHERRRLALLRLVMLEFEDAPAVVIEDRRHLLELPRQAAGDALEREAPPLVHEEVKPAALLRAPLLLNAQKGTGRAPLRRLEEGARGGDDGLVVHLRIDAKHAKSGGHEGLLSRRKEQELPDVKRSVPSRPRPCYGPPPLRGSHGRDPP